MNLHGLKKIVPNLSLGIVLVLFSRCAGPDEMTLPGPDVEAEVTAAAQTGALAGPYGDSAGGMIAGMIDLIGPVPSENPFCPELFHLPGGISGSCSLNDGDGMTWLFSGTVAVDGDEIMVDGNMGVAPSAEQPATGACYEIEFNATVFGMRGIASWASTGSVCLDGDGDLSDCDLTITDTITPSGGETATVLIMVDPSVLEIGFTGLLGGNVTITLDRDTMNGILSLSGTQVATITISGGCTTVVSVVPAIPDQTVCAGPA